MPAHHFQNLSCIEEIALHKNAPRLRFRKTLHNNLIGWRPQPCTKMHDVAWPLEVNHTTL
jgi:hypothetical protein